MERYDAAVVGSGPAGLSAAVNLSIRKKRFILFGSPKLSRKLSSAPRIDNYLGLPSISGAELQGRFLSHIAEMGIEIIEDQVQTVISMGGYFSLACAKEAYEASAVILATGAFMEKTLKGEEEFLGRGVGYCATCDAPLYRGKTVAVVGYTGQAAREADYVAEIAGKVYYIPMRGSQARPGGGVEILDGELSGVAGNDSVRSLIFTDGRSVAVDGVFILRESLAPASLAPGIAMEGGFIRVGQDMATSLPGCFAAGDCTGQPHQFMRAAGQGQTAALRAAEYLDNQKRQP